MLGFHSLYAPDPATLRSKPKRSVSKVAAEEVVFDREKEVDDSREVTRKVGRLLGGSAQTTSATKGKKSAPKKSGAKKTAVKKAAGKKKASKAKKAKTAKRKKKAVKRRRKQSSGFGRRKFSGAGINIYSQLSRLGLLSSGKKRKKRPRKKKR